MSQCDLCEAKDSLASHEVPSATPRENAITVCATCAAELAKDQGFDANHWRCLSGAIWSEKPAVQVQSVALLRALADESWASELLEQAYLSEDVQAWADELAAANETLDVRDSNGTPLAAGDSVTLIKALDVKGAGFTAKRGTMVKNIRLTDDPGLIEGKVGGTMIVLKTEFLKKA